MEPEKKDIKGTLLEVAEALFAQKGFDGIAIDEIAREAKANKSLIYYYFSNKEGLLINIIQKHVIEFEQLVSKIQPDQNKRFDEMLKDIITLAIHYVCEHENIIKIMQQESLLEYETRNNQLDIFSFIDPLWHKLLGGYKARYPEITDLSFIDKSICTMLVINFSIILDRLNKNNPEEIEEAKRIYIERASGIISLIVSKSLKD